jgi:hypothetical protein
LQLWRQNVFVCFCGVLLVVAENVRSQPPLTQKIVTFFVVGEGGVFF